MKQIKIAILFALGSACVIHVADGQDTRMTMEAAREQGRSKSRYLKKTKAAEEANDLIPKANVADFQKSVAPILTKSCVDCHVYERGSLRDRREKSEDLRREISRLSVSILANSATCCVTPKHELSFLP